MKLVECKRTFNFLSELQAVEIQNPYFVISSIIMVGALLSQDNHMCGSVEFDDIQDDNALSFTDRFRLEEYLKSLISLGIRLEKPTIHICDLIYGDDFINDTPHADFIFLSFINKDCNQESPLLKEGHTWNEAHRKSNPKVIGLDGDGATCVSYADLPNDSYTQIPSKGSFGSFSKYDANYIRNELKFF